MIDTWKLVEWLGPEGTRSGLRDSDVSLAELIDIARARGLPLAPKPTRDEVANELAYENVKKLEKSPEDLARMSHADISDYFEKKKPTIREILEILQNLGIRPGSEDRKHLMRFAAREIAEIGVFQRVAHGSPATASKRS